MPARIEIRPPRRDPPININDTWQNIVEPAILQIYRLQSEETTKKLSFKVLYDSIYKLVTQGHGRALHRKFKEATHCYLTSLPPLVLNTKHGVINDEYNANSGELLESVSQLWKGFQVSLTLIGDIFMYLDRSFCGETGTPTTDQVGRQLFREDVLNDNLDSLFEQLLRQINKDRRKELVNYQTLQLIIKLLKGLTEDNSENSPSLYDAKFRNHLIEDSVKVYNSRLNNLSSETSLFKLHKIDEWLQEEAQLGLLYLPEDTRLDLIKCLENEVFDPGLAQIFKHGENIKQWITDNNLEALRLASELEARATSRNLVLEVSKVLSSNQLEANEKERDALKWVEQTIFLRNKFIKISEAIGQNSWKTSLHRTHQKAIGESSEASNLLAVYLDEHLKKSASIPSDQVEPALDNALIIYNSLVDSDEFSLIFQRLLARRLLNNSSRSREFEFSWLQRLKEENINSDSLKFERMIANIDESRQLFSGSASISPGIVPTSVNVLSMHLWPKSMLPQAQFPVVLPTDIADAQAKFENFYSLVKKDRVLKWNYGLSNVDVKIRIGDKSYLVSVPLVCMSILNLFSGDEVYTTKEISELTKIPMGGEIERHLKSLYIAQGTELLVKDPIGKDVNTDDKFKFNTNFKSPRSRFKVKKISASKTTGVLKMNKEDADFLAQERAQKAEAAIVRIMKAKKVISHGPLIQIAATMLHQHFNATPQLIKRSIQSLLAKEYIERDENDPEMYKYIA